jgi:hypothetical protein
MGAGRGDDRGLSICWLYHLASIGLSPAKPHGTRARAAVESAVVICVTPGPQVTEATPVFPVAL